MEKDTLLGKSLKELQDIVIELQMPSFTAKQIADWLYKKQVHSIEDMQNISKANRTLLAEKYDLGYAEAVSFMESVDGTKKYLFQVGKEFIETVFIPDQERFTLCVSSQIGCKMDCAFCMTGKQGFNGQLSSGQIINQIIAIPEASQLTNIVFMGMGEPLDNTAELLKSLEILTADYGFAWSPKRITVSSIGLIPGLKAFLSQSNCHLAISMHTPFSKERLEIMPVEKAYPIERVVEELRQIDFSHQRRLSFEYIMFDGYNDTMRHARELVRLLRGLECRVNLIRFHAIPGVDLKSSNEEQMLQFRDYLTDNRITTTIRKSRGEDIFAACGMLSSSKKAE